MHFTDEQPFLDAIFARPADDRPRLVYADFLDDCGESARAELVRVQLALACLHEDDPRKPSLLERQAELLNANRERWTAHLAGIVETVDFRRGIPDSATVQATMFLEHGEELFRQLPIRRLRLREPVAVMAKLAAFPLMARVRELDLCNSELDSEAFASLVGCPHFRKLEFLDLGFNGLQDRNMELLSRSSHFSALTALSLNDNDTIGDSGVRSLASSPFFGCLRTLDLSGNEIGDHGVRELVTSETLGSLKSLRLNNNEIGDTGIAALVASPLFKRIIDCGAKLEIRENLISHIGAKAVARSEKLAMCKSLDFSHNYLGDNGAAVLLQSPHLKKVRILRLAGNQITDACLLTHRATLRQLLPQLTLLDLSANRLTRTGMNLLESLRETHTVRIDLSDNVQSVVSGNAPVAVSDVLPSAFDGLVETARLRHRAANPE